MKSRLPSPLPREAWPFVDQDAWDSATRESHPLADDENGGGAHWRASTRRSHQIRYGAWLAWLKSVYRLDETGRPASRATRDNVRAYIRAMESVGLSDHTRAGRLHSLHDVLRAMQPESEVRFIADASRAISRTAERARDLRAKMCEPIEVLRFAVELMEQADRTSGTAQLDARARLFRDGLLIGLWVYRPLRIANLANIELEQNCVSVGDGYRLAFSGDEMKGRRPFSCAWPPELNLALRRYLQIYRPALLARPEGFSSTLKLWVSRSGQPMAQASVAQAIRLRTQRRFRRAFNPHLMRYAVASFLAEHDPANIADVAAILDHSSLETSEEHYILANSVGAVAKFQAAILSKRRSLA